LLILTITLNSNFKQLVLKVVSVTVSAKICIYYM